MKIKDKDKYKKDIKIENNSIFAIDKFQIWNYNLFEGN